MCGTVLRRFAFVAALAISISLYAEDLKLPTRASDAPTGSAIAEKITSLDRTTREEEILKQFASGNIPNFLRKLTPVETTIVDSGVTNLVVLHVTPDYLALGSDDDYFLIPLTPAMAQRIADLVDCSLPTPKMVDQIYAAAPLKLTPSPIPPTAAMITVPQFWQHNLTVRTQRFSQLGHPLGVLVAGHKKDVVVSAKLADAPSKVVIYGWHKSDGKPIQPVYSGHAASWADYSLGIRLVSNSVLLKGANTTLGQILTNSATASLLSNEGPLSSVRYSTNAPPEPSSPSKSFGLTSIKLSELNPSGTYNERTATYNILPDVRVHINAPMQINPSAPLKLVFFALPNGNTIEQTVGRKLKPGDDWHFDIQHIGAQTRFLRNSESNLVVIYLEAGEKSWPTWRKKHLDQPGLIPQIVESIRKIFPGSNQKLVLTGHSGGGSFTFGYINGVDSIPDEVERIAFLDSNYGYDSTQGHREKFLKWIDGPTPHYLCVLAYHDSIALLNGKTFVSAAGGTWGRSHEMIKDFDPELHFKKVTEGNFHFYIARDGRVNFILRENPEKAIYHTVQVEKNGFIHAIVIGTPRENVGYSYFGPRVYTELVSE